MLQAYKDIQEDPELAAEAAKPKGKSKGKGPASGASGWVSVAREILRDKKNKFIWFAKVSWGIPARLSSKSFLWIQENKNCAYTLSFASYFSQRNQDFPSFSREIRFFAAF